MVWQLTNKRLSNKRTYSDYVLVATHKYICLASQKLFAFFSKKKKHVYARNGKGDRLSEQRDCVHDKQVSSSSCCCCRTDAQYTMPPKSVCKAFTINTTHDKIYIYLDDSLETLARMFTWIFIWHLEYCELRKWVVLMSARKTQQPSLMCAKALKWISALNDIRLIVAYSSVSVCVCVHCTYIYFRYHMHTTQHNIPAWTLNSQSGHNFCRQSRERIFLSWQQNRICFHCCLSISPLFWSFYSICCLRCVCVCDFRFLNKFSTYFSTVCSFFFFIHTFSFAFSFSSVRIRDLFLFTLCHTFLGYSISYICATL